MPNRRPSRKQAARSRRVPWFRSVSAWAGLVAAAAVCSVGVYWMTRPVAPDLVQTVAAQTAPVAPVYTKKHIYSETADPNADIAAGLAQAKREHKRVILDFGGDWCGDCQVLDIYFHQAPNAELLEKNFVLVHVWVGHMDTNVEVAAKYGVPLTHGVPALAVVAADGAVLYSQATGQFSAMRRMEASSVTDFLTKWKS